MPDDDSSFYNIGVEDDLSSKIHGSLRILNSSIEVCGSGYVLTNHVTGKRFPFATYKAAVMARGGVSQRYQAISRGDTPALSTAGI